MRVRLAATADYVNQTTDHRLNIMGAYINLTRPRGEAVMSMLHAVFILQFDSEDFLTEKKFQAVVFDPDGRHISHGDEVRLFIPPPPENQLLAANFIAAIKDVPFQAVGTYHVSLMVNDQRFHDIELRVAAETEGVS